MALSRQEIQKRYRERKKQTDPNYVKKERERKRKAYIPVEMLSPNDLKKRRDDVRKRVNKHYKKKKESERKLETADSDKRKTRGTGGKLIARALEYKTKQKKNDVLRKKHSSALKMAYKEIKALKVQNVSLQKEKKTIQKRLERHRNQRDDRNFNYSSSTVGASPEPCTPNSKANLEMREQGLTPRKHKSIKKKLLFSHVIANYNHQKKQKTVTMKVLRKYRCIAIAKRTFGKSWRKGLGIEEGRQTKTKSSQKKLVREKVVSFLEREDNSTMMAGKKDCSSGKNKIQKRVLNDYLHNLHRKFCLENPDVKISRASFCYMRPKHLLLANFCNRQTCLCSRHQNLALKLRSLHNQGVRLSKNPDYVVKHFSNDEIRSTVCNDLLKEDVQYIEWKKVSENGKFRWRQIQISEKKNEFLEKFMLQVEDFKGHVSRVAKQYSETKRLRENLPQGHSLIWMDFAENFTCTALEEVQSAYWTADMVTLHTSITYFPKSHTKSHLSVVGISETLSHNVNSVHAMLVKLIPIIKEEYHDLQEIHYLTDSPTSQYRNKTIFNMICDHESMFGTKASWDYLEAGHGKGPCDGLGASVKRSADSAIKQGKTTIQNALDFYKWTENTESNSVVKFYYVSQDEYNTSEALLKEISRGIKPISGTMLVHSAVPISQHEIATRETSCHCAECMRNIHETTCTGWSIHVIRAPNANVILDQNATNTAQVQEIAITTEQSSLYVKPAVGQYVIALYENKKYVGLVEDVDVVDGDAKINFMKESTKKKNVFVWPVSKDELWCEFTDILFIIAEPEALGKRTRMFKLKQEDVNKMN